MTGREWLDTLKVARKNPEYQEIVERIEGATKRYAEAKTALKESENKTVEAMHDMVVSMEKAGVVNPKTFQFVYVAVGEEREREQAEREANSELHNTVRERQAFMERLLRKRGVS